MHPYSRSLDVTRLQRDARRATRYRAIVRARARWGDPLLAGVLLALAAWALVEIRAAETAGGALVVAEGRNWAAPGQMGE